MSERNRLKRQAQQERRKTERATQQAANVTLWRGIITEQLPHATWRKVRRGSKSRTAKPDIRIADLGIEATWQGIALPVGTRLLVDLSVADEIGSVGEIVATPTHVRVHIWRASSTREEIRQPLTPIMPPMLAPTPPWLEEENLNDCAI